MEKILHKILTCYGGNLFEECPSIHEVHESWYHLPIIQSLFYTTFLNNLFTKTRAVFKICFDCFWILEPWFSFLVVWSAKSCSICEFDFLLHFAANRLHHRISQFQHISLRYLQFSCCLGLYLGTLTFILPNLEWKVLYWLGVWFFFKITFCSKSFSPTYFPVSAHLFPLSSLLRRMVPEVCNLHLVLAVALLTHKSVTTFGCWFVCTSKQEILLIRAEAFIMVIVCGTVKFWKSYRGERFFAHNYC